MDSYLYTLWQEKASDEEPGCYLARIISVNGNGDIVLKYRKGGLLEKVSLGSNGLLLKEMEHGF